MQCLITGPDFRQRGHFRATFLRLPKSAPVFGASLAKNEVFQQKQYSDSMRGIKASLVESILSTR
jgi:hypothetical protein